RRPRRRRWPGGPAPASPARGRAGPGVGRTRSCPRRRGTAAPVPARPRCAPRPATGPGRSRRADGGGELGTAGREGGREGHGRRLEARPRVVAEGGEAAPDLPHVVGGGGGEPSQFVPAERHGHGGPRTGARRVVDDRRGAAAVAQVVDEDLALAALLRQ